MERGVFTLILVAFLVLEKVQGQNVTSCPSGFTQFASSCYRFVRKEAFYGAEIGIPWFQAGLFCSMYTPNAYRTHLVTIETQQEHDFLRTTIDGNAALRSHDFWIGLSHHDKQKQWMWAPTQQEVHTGYSNWAPGNPEGWGDCAALWNQSPTRQWIDMDCGTYLNFICEVELDTK